MKRFLFSLFAVCALLALPPALPRAVRAAAEPVYALIVSENAVLLRDAKEPSVENSYFILPATYFVQVVNRDYAPGYHYVRYRDAVGYVRDTDVEIKDYIPKSIYPPEVKLKINIDSSTVNVRSLPDLNAGRVLYSLPADSQGVVYYNYVAGVAASGSNNTWYYVRVDLGADSVIKGYIYAPYVLLESTIPPDNDTTAVVVPPDEVVDPGTKPEGSKPDTIELIGILALCIPAVLIVVVIFARPRKHRDKPDDKKFTS